MADKYGQSFYQDRHRQTVHAAEAVLAVVLDALPPVRSAVDFGCGVGTWLSVLKGMGVGEILGVDGPWVDRGLLEIGAEEFRSVNFKEPVALGRRYDLALSLEVAEHLAPEQAGPFVDSLTAASDCVLFSAAIPRQGGVGHLNERWQGYWAGLFAERGYVLVDIVRGAIWDDGRIPVWYRQNALLFVKQERIDSLRLPEQDRLMRQFPASIVHPEKYLAMLREASSIKGSLRMFLRALARRVRGKPGP